MKLEARALAFGYPERPVGRDLSLSVAPGEVMCLLGPNGCGKTTLFRTLLGLLRAQGGEILLGGDRLSGLARQEVARRVAYVPQAQSGSFPYTALDIVLMGRTAHRNVFESPNRQDRDIARKALAQLGIESLAGHDVTRLSGGQRQLVILARAVAQATPLMIMDEPTASLDFGNQVNVLREVRKLADCGAGIILSTHNPDHAFAVADRVMLMQEGAVIGAGEPGEVLTSRALQQAYRVTVSVQRLQSGQIVCVPEYKAAPGVRNDDV